MALWNLLLPGKQGTDKRVVIKITGSAENSLATIYRLDSTHGSAGSAYAAMGKPPFPTQAQIESLRKAASLPEPERLRIQHGHLTIDLPPHGLALIELQ
jgi:beta-xylosidase